MTEQADATRLQIVVAASHEFASKSYTQVSLDDILANARPPPLGSCWATAVGVPSAVGLSPGESSGPSIRTSL